MDPPKVGIAKRKKINESQFSINSGHLSRQFIFLCNIVATKLNSSALIQVNFGRWHRWYYL
ncbi:MAG TPA: hypothetical protein VE619_04500 [Nitrososphaeraceae archaeon]|nr:hypothetical protein [Nitrososphaeraceae archaeon]